MRRLALLVLLLLLLVLPPAPARAGRTSGIRVDTIVHGIKLSLILDKQTYPANALVRATVRVKNLSGAAIDLGASSGRFCPTTSPGIRVLDGAGAIVYPPEVDDYSICTPLPYNGVLPPGGSIQRHLLAMLRSSYLQAVVSVGRYTGIESAILPLHLRPASPLSAVLSLEPSPYADVEQPSAGYGPLYSFQVAECRTATSDTVIGSLHWEAIPRQGKSIYRLLPKCQPLSTWHVVTGFLDHPVAAIDYVKPQAQPQSLGTNQHVTSSGLPCSNPEQPKPHQQQFRDQQLSPRHQYYSAGGSAQLHAGGSEGVRLLRRTAMQNAQEGVGLLPLPHHTGSGERRVGIHFVRTRLRDRKRHGAAAGQVVQRNVLDSPHSWQEIMESPRPDHPSSGELEVWEGAQPVGPTGRRIVSLIDHDVLPALQIAGPEPPVNWTGQRLRIDHAHQPGPGELPALEDAEMRVGTRRERAEVR